MATQNKKLRSIIRSLIEEMLSEDCGCGNADCEECNPPDVNEANTTANIDGYQTPHAFDKSEDEEGHAKRIKANAEVFDYKTTENESNNTIKLNEGRSLYHLFRDHPDLTPRQKIGVTMRHINNMLSEVEKVLNIGSRFKTENNISSDSYWKTTSKYLNKLDNKVQTISRKLRELK